MSSDSPQPKLVVERKNMSLVCDQQVDAGRNTRVVQAKCPHPQTVFLLLSGERKPDSKWCQDCLDFVPYRYVVPTVDQFTAIKRRNPMTAPILGSNPQPILGTCRHDWRVRAALLAPFQVIVWKCRRCRVVVTR